MDDKKTKKLKAALIQVRERTTPSMSQQDKVRLFIDVLTPAVEEIEGGRKPRPQK